GGPCRLREHLRPDPLDLPLAGPPRARAGDADDAEDHGGGRAGSAPPADRAASLRAAVRSRPAAGGGALASAVPRLRAPADRFRDVRLIRTGTIRASGE